MQLEQERPGHSLSFACEFRISVDIQGSNVQVSRVYDGMPFLSHCFPKYFTAWDSTLMGGAARNAVH